ncbi:hypothetical protein M9435_003538 [Picochlorum sp. BPE23]|nr:hypothetical protein M9435_003538 [Picochlorum sp. BPE23]
MPAWHRALPQRDSKPLRRVASSILDGTHGMTLFRPIFSVKHGEQYSKQRKLMRKLVFIAAIMLCMAQTSSAENAYTMNGNTVYCPDGCSLGIGGSVSSSTTKQELLSNCVCTCDGVQSECSEKRITSDSVAIRGLVRFCVLPAGLKVIAGLWIPLLNCFAKS